MSDTAIKPTRKENYPEWYQEVIKASDLAENAPVRGCMVIKPWGYALWENMQSALDKKFKETGHVNAYFPLLIPLSFLEKEAEHVEGFAKECAVVTHHRLTAGQGEKAGHLVPDPESLLEEPYIIRPTSETIIGHMYAKWVKSYRDLPILMNQWCNVMRWEMRTRLFLRTTEFLWQEGHTVHATAEEANLETLKMLDVYEDFAQNYMAMPVYKGLKTPDERFPGAVDTYTIEALMQDGKALQAGTSHFLGQNFAKASGIKFLSKEGKEETAWTTSWGVSTRLIGGLIMTHSDDNGLVLPPRLAPKQVVILPIFRNDQEKAEVLAACKKLEDQLRQQQVWGEPIRVKIDDRDLRGGDKVWQAIKQGVPVRIEMGPRDLAKGEAVVATRDQGPKEKASVKLEDLSESICQVLQRIQEGLFAKALALRESRTKNISSLAEFKSYFAAEAASGDTSGPGYAVCYWHEAALKDEGAVQLLKELKVTARCIPFAFNSHLAGSAQSENLAAENAVYGHCLFTGEKTATQVLFARSY